MPKLQSVQVNLNVPYLGSVQGTWIPDENEQRAAWELYVELVTRISVAELQPGESLLREALSSLYTLFETTRQILRKYGPSIAVPKKKGDLSFGYLAVLMLNTVLRPVLAKWHPILLDYEGHKDPYVTPLEHERQWDKNDELRQALNDVRSSLKDYANLLGDVAKVPSLIVEEPKGEGL